MPDLDDVLSRLEDLLAEMEALDDPVRDRIFELLDGIDLIHRIALTRLAEQVSPELIEALRKDPAVSWMLDAYGIGVNERAAADSALEEIRPYIHSHGGKVEVLDAHMGIVRLHMSGACSGCTASAVTLKEGIEEALRKNFPSFVAIEVEEDNAPQHPPPEGPTLHQLRIRPTSKGG